MTPPDGSNELDFKLVARAHEQLLCFGPVFVDELQRLLSQHTRANARMNDDRKLPKYENRSWVRSRPVKAMFCPPEYADLETIAEGWGVPVSTAMWALVVGELARWRRQAPDRDRVGAASVDLVPGLVRGGPGSTRARKAGIVRG